MVSPMTPPGILCHVVKTVSYMTPPGLSRTTPLSSTYRCPACTSNVRRRWLQNEDTPTLAFANNRGGDARSPVLVKPDTIDEGEGALCAEYRRESVADPSSYTRSFSYGMLPTPPPPPVASHFLKYVLVSTATWDTHTLMRMSDSVRNAASTDPIGETNVLVAASWVTKCSLLERLIRSTGYNAKEEGTDATSWVSICRMTQEPIFYDDCVQNRTPNIYCGKE
ncbi:hypothetical protein ACFE04_000040 [Oxalis oulophora]